jgi:O-antigen ligase
MAVDHLSSNTGSTNPRLITTAMVLAGLALGIAPFRASAGIRAGLLLLAAGVILFAYRRSDSFRAFIPPFRFLNIAILLWVVGVAAWACFSPDPAESLKSWRGNVLTPILAGGVFYALTNNIRTFITWLAVLFVGLAALTWFALAPVETSHAPGYVPWFVDVGFLSTWLVILFPFVILAAQLAFMRAPEMSVALRTVPPSSLVLGSRLVIIASMVMLFAATSATNNRAAWGCFMLVLAVQFLFALLDQRAVMSRPKLISIYLGAFLLLAWLLSASVEFRAALSTQGTQGGVEFLLRDVRSNLWQHAWEMIQARPFAGHGYATQDLGTKFAAPFTHLSAHPLLQHAHNVLLNYALQMGIFGAVIIVVLFAALLAAFVPFTRTPGLPRTLGVCGISLVVTFFARNMVDDFFQRHTLMFFAATCGMLLGLARSASISGAARIR